MAGSPWAAPFHWSEENTQRLIDLWQSGRTGYEIAEILRITRNKVMGKLNRIGLLDGSRGKSPFNNEAYRIRVMTNKIAKAKASPPTPSKGRVERVPIAAPSPPPLPEKRPSSWPGLAGEIDVLRSGECRWPIGDPTETFCKAPTEETYCLYHRVLASRPPGSPKEWYEDAATGKKYWR